MIATIADLLRVCICEYCDGTGIGVAWICYDVLLCGIR